MYMAVFEIGTPKKTGGNYIFSSEFSAFLLAEAKAQKYVTTRIHTN